MRERPDRVATGAAKARREQARREKEETKTASEPIDGGVVGGCEFLGAKAEIYDQEQKIPGVMDVRRGGEVQSTNKGGRRRSRREKSR